MDQATLFWVMVSSIAVLWVVVDELKREYFENK